MDAWTLLMLVGVSTIWVTILSAIAWFVAVAPARNS